MISRTAEFEVCSIEISLNIGNGKKICMEKVAGCKGPIKKPLNLTACLEVFEL